MGFLSFGVLRSWQGVVHIVEVILRVICIVLIGVTFITLIAAIRSLSSQDTPITPIEQLRFDTRSPIGWNFLLTLVAIPITIIALVLRFLGFSPIVNNTKFLLIADAIVTGVLAAGYFCGAVPLAVHAGDWKFWMGRGSTSDNETYGIGGIVSSVEAASVFSFLCTLSLAVLAVWIVLYVILGWGFRERLYKVGRNEGAAPKVKVVASEDQMVIIKDKENSN